MRRSPGFGFPGLHVLLDAAGAGRRERPTFALHECRLEHPAEDRLGRRPLRRAASRREPGGAFRPQHRTARRGGAGAQPPRALRAAVFAGGRPGAGRERHVCELCRRVRPHQPQSRHRAPRPTRHRQVRAAVLRLSARLARDADELPALRRATLAASPAMASACATTPRASRRSTSSGFASALGYAHIDLYGASYGTRVAELYLRHHPAVVHAVILDGVTYPEQVIGPDTPLDGERALHLILGRCVASPQCARGLSRLAGRFRPLARKFGPASSMLEMPDPGTDAPLEMEFNRGVFAAALRLLSYNATQASLLPTLIHEASGGRLAPLAAQTVMMAREVRDQVASGMQNSVVCSEDVPFFASAGIDRRAIEATYQGTEQLDAFTEICKLWPRGPVDADLHAPLHSDVPALLLSGEADPVTPPADADGWRADSRAIVISSSRRGTWSARHGLHATIDGRFSGFPRPEGARCRVPGGTPPGAVLRRRDGTRAMIEACGLSKRFGAIDAVRDVSFHAADGEITGLLGPNGAGKSTTLRMLYGVLTPDGGSARIDGIDIRGEMSAARGPARCSATHTRSLRQFDRPRRTFNTSAHCRACRRTACATARRAVPALDMRASSIDARKASPKASASRSPWREPSSTIHRTWFSTSRPTASM